MFQQLNLQLLIVTPLQKIHVIEPFVSTVGFVHNEDGRASKLRNLTIEEYRAEKAARAARPTEAMKLAEPARPTEPAAPMKPATEFAAE